MTSAEATIWTLWTSLQCLLGSWHIWYPLLQTRQPIIILRCFLMWVRIQSRFECLKVYKWHRYSLSPPGLFRCSGYAWAGIMSLSTTTTGYEADLVDRSEKVELVNGTGESDDQTRVGMIWWSFGVDTGISWDSIAIVRLSSLGINSVDIGLETPNTGTDVRVGAGEVEVYIWGWGQTEVVMGTGLVCIHPHESRSITAGG